MCLQPGRDALMNTIHTPLPFTAGVRPWPPGGVTSAGPDAAISVRHRLSHSTQRPSPIPLRLSPFARSASSAFKASRAFTANTAFLAGQACPVASVARGSGAESL